MPHSWGRGERRDRSDGRHVGNFGGYGALVPHPRGAGFSPLADRALDLDEDRVPYGRERSPCSYLVDAARPFELPPLLWYDVLWAAYNAPGKRLRQYELADRMPDEPERVSRLIDRIEAAGLIRREAVQSDRRGAQVVATAKGKAMMQRMWPVYRKAIDEHFARWAGADSEVVSGALTRVAAGATQTEHDTSHRGLADEALGVPPFVSTPTVHRSRPDARLWQWWVRGHRRDCSFAAWRRWSLQGRPPPRPSFAGPVAGHMDRLRNAAQATPLT